MRWLNGQKPLWMHSTILTEKLLSIAHHNKCGASFVASPMMIRCCRKQEEQSGGCRVGNWLNAPNLKLTNSIALLHRHDLASSGRLPAPPRHRTKRSLKFAPHIHTFLYRLKLSTPGHCTAPLRQSIAVMSSATAQAQAGSGSWSAFLKVWADPWRQVSH